MKTLYIIRGVPGSGKTTLSNHLAGEDNVCEADKYFINEHGEYNYNRFDIGKAHKFCEACVKARMKIGAYRIAVSNTFIRTWEIDPYLRLAKEFGYNVFIIVSDHNGKSTHGVPLEKVEEMRGNFQPYNSFK